MLKKSAVEQLSEQLGSMNTTDLMQLSEQIIRLMAGKNNTEDTSAYRLIESSTDGGKMLCKGCGSEVVLKYGKDRNGHQRYKCRDCGKTFTLTTDTVLANTKKPAYVWRNFIVATIKGLSLAASASECHISVPTAFAWRHKIYHAMGMPQGNAVLNGVVEMDETFINVSYKGNHKKSQSFVMPRPAFERGTDNRPKTYDERACVFCAVERGVQAFGVVPFCGMITVKSLTSLLDKRFGPDAIVLTDLAHPYIRYFKEHSIENIPLKGASGAGPTKIAPIVKGPYHINTINSLHRRFERFLEPCNGVSTKYLNNYLSCFVWMENQRLCKAASLAHSGEVALCRDGSALTAKKLIAWPAKPHLNIAA